MDKVEDVSEDKVKEKIAKGEKPVFIVDVEILVNMFEGKKTENDMIKTLYELKKINAPFDAITTYGALIF